ncbi:MAG: uroporphyrinogen decarboxylase family protein [Candidatus Binatia bacterium]|nr:uroporphyrinogen decarboxylase family protein [Candidatus Binatia bacterium]
MSSQMSSEERIQAAIDLKETDRVPITMMCPFFAARYAGIPAEEFMDDKEKYHYAMDRTFDDFGGWDAMWATGGIDYVNSAFMFGMKMRYPGKDLPADTPFQLVEEPIIDVEDYDVILERGWSAFSGEIMARVRPELFGGAERRQRIKEARVTWSAQLARDIRRWQERGVAPIVGGFTGFPFATLSLMRGLEDLTVDLYRVPDKVQAVLEDIAEKAIGSGIAQVKASGIRRVFIADTRSCAGMLSLKFFERFSFPFMKKIVSTFAEEGIVSVLHFDQDWTRNLPYFLEFPPKSCILQLDGATNIFRAKEVLGEHMCIQGDVPASLLALGTPGEVKEYIQRLIEEVGRGGGYILSSGCEVPVNARPENVRAMLESVRK